MKNNIRLGIWRYLLPVPEGVWHGKVDQSAVQNQQALDALPPDHQRVRNYAVRELPRLGQPLPPEQIARALDLPLAQVNVILEDLEKRMTFLYRNETASVVWAYPVTVERTPHRATLSSGESIFAA